MKRLIRQSEQLFNFEDLPTTQAYEKAFEEIEDKYWYDFTNLAVDLERTHFLKFKENGSIKFK